MSFVFLMLRTSLNYLSFDSNTQFLQFKQIYIQNTVWKTAFYTHTFSAFLTLLTGFTQFSQTIIRHKQKWHRRLGYFYIGNILLINFPASFIMAIFANGGFISKIAFLLLSILWFTVTLKAFISAKNNNFKSHRNFMIRSFALTLSAITFRLWKIILLHLDWVEAASIYPIQAWIGFIPNIIIAEIIITNLANKTHRSTDQ